MKTAKFIVGGKVQGVFFRSAVRKKALELGICGYAKNLEDGNVEIVAQGDVKRIAALKEFIHSNPGASRVGSVEEKLSGGEFGTLHGFEVR